MPLIPLDSEAEIQPVDSTGSGFAVGSIPQQQSQGSFLQPQDRASSQQPARLQPQGQNFLDDPFFVERSVEANKRTLRQMRRQAALIPLGEASPVAEPAPVATPETEYHWEGAAKQAGYGIARTMGANLPSAIGKTFDFINRAEPGDESSLTKIGEENKAQYDLWKKKSVDIQDLNKAIARHTESYLTQAVAQSGETLGALGINAVGTAAGSLVGMPWLGTALSAATFQDLNYEDVYNQAIEKGATPDAAKKAGYINGTIDSILDSLQLKALQSVFKPASKLTNFLWKLGATSLFTEGGLEGVQGVQETIGSEWAAKPKEETAAQFTQRMWDNRSELWQTFKDNAIPAAIMSAGIGVPGHIMGSMSNSQLVKGIKNGLENGKMTTDDVRTLLDSKLKDADESTKRKIEGLISKEKEDVATTEEPPLPEAPPEELIPLDEANVPDLELQPAPALSPQNVGIEIPSPESQTFIEGQPIIPQGVVQPSVNQEQVTSPDVSTQGAGQTPGIESSPVVLPQAGPQEGAPANVPGAQSVTEPLLNVAAPVQEEKTAKSGQAAGELTEDTKINGVTFRQLEDLIINDKPGIKKELEDIKGLHGRAGMQDLVNPGKLYARLRKRLVTEQGMTKDQAKDALQGPFKRYEQRFKEVEGGIENAESVRGNEGQIKTGRDVGQEGQGKGGEDLQLQEPEKASGQEGGINRKAFYSGIEIGKKELDIHRESKTGTETTYRYRPFKYQGAEYLAVQKNMPGARGPEFEVRAPTGHVVQNFKREGAKYNGTFNFAGINTLKDFYHKVSTLAQDDAVNFLDDYHYSQPTPKQSPTVAPEPQAAGGPGGVNQSKVAYYDTVFEEEAKTKYPHHISILNKITREDNFPTVWMTPPYKGKNHLGKVDITQGVIDVHPQMIERLAKKIAKYHDVTVNDVLPELYKEIIQHEQVHIKQQSDMRLPNKRISKNHPLEIEAYEQGNIRKAIDKIIETKKQSAHEESNPIPTNKEALRQKNLEKREAVRAAREKKGEGSIPQQDTTNLKGGVPNAKETSKANAEKGQSREAVPGFQVSAQAQKEKIERKARNAEQGETKLNLSDITLNNQTFSDNRKAVGQFRKWMRTAGLSKELLDKLDVEVKNTLKIIGNVRRSEAEHGRKLSDLGKAIGATTFFDDASVLVQFADNMNFIQAEDTAYHEAFHVMLNKLVSEENRTALLDHFNGNEENAAKAFSKFVANQETTSIPKPIRKIFYQIKKILTRIGNAFRQSGYKTPEDFFKAIYFGVDLKGGRPSGVNEFAQSVKLSLDKAVKKITDNPNFVKWFGGSKVVGEDGEPLVVYHGTRSGGFDTFNTDNGAFFAPSKEAAKSYTSLRQSQSLGSKKVSNPPKIFEVYLKLLNPLDLTEYNTDEKILLYNAGWIGNQKESAEKLRSILGSPSDAKIKEALIETGYNDKLLKNLYHNDPAIYMAKEIFRISETDSFRGATSHNLISAFKYKVIKGQEVFQERVDKTVKSFLEKLGFDGILFNDTDVGSFGNQNNIKVSVVFSPTQIKSIYNVGTFDPNNPDIRLQVEAWHGSPHEWAGGKLDLSKVGTGEGEQAFGWGAYFTDLEDVAKHYASSLSRVSPGKYREKYGENRVEVYLWAVGEHQKAISNMKERIKSQKEYIKKWGELGESKKALVGMKELLADMEAGDFNPEVPNRNLYKVTLHKSKQPGEYTWLDWRETPSKDIINKVIAQKEKEGGASTHFKNEVKKAGVFPGQGQDLYETLSLLATRGSYSQKGASLLLFRAGIDGIRYPAGMLSGQKTDAKNYVVFDESAVTVEAHTKFNLKPEPRIDYIGDMEDANGNTFGLYNVFGVDGRADGSTVTENTLRKLGLIPEGKRAQTKLNIASTAKEFHAGMATATEDVVGFFKGLSQTKKIRAANKAMRKADTTAFDRYFATPFFSFRKVPAAWRMFEDGQKRDENFHTKVDELSKAGDGQYWTIKLAQAKRQIPEEFKKIWKIFKHLDQNAIGHKVEAGKDKGTFVLKDTKGKEVGVFPSENDAWEAATQRDLEALRKRGLSKQAVNAGEAIIRMRHAGFNLLSKNIREVIAKYEELGMDLPKYSVWQDGEKIVVDLKMELARLGDLRGYYMPHSWKPGRIIVYARREGAHGVIKKFDTEIMAANWERDMQGKGYKTESKISGPMPEDVFDMAGQTVAVNAMLNESLERLKKKDFTLAEFDLKGEFVKATGKNKDFRLIGPTNKRQGQILKDMGGKWYQAKRDNVEHWHFMNKPPTFEKKLTKALALSSISGEVDKQTAMLFAGGLAEQLGNIIKERGARKHMIHRSGAKGVEVWEGYEEDPDLAMAQYVRSLAAGEAKHVMAVDMVKHMTGTDISWKEYKAMIEDEQDKTPEYEEYLDFVKDRGIDAIGQPHIFKDASAYMKDMLRNQEASDRVIGIVKGLAVLKYLGFKLSALPINMSAMLTTVPASMKAYGDISIGKAFGHMARMSKMYVQYERYKRSNDASLLPQKYIDLFQEMEKKGYGKPQFNRETLATLESKMGRGYSRLIELSMTPFAISETFNRMVTISAAYEGLRAQGKSHEEALKIAKDVSDHAHAIYGKGNYPHILRGENLASQVLKCGYVFKQFNHNYLQAMWDMGYNKHDAKATMWMAASPIFLSGMGAFAGTALIKAALQALGADDPEEWFYNQVEENLGQKAGTVARVGLPGLVGVSLKGSLAIDLTGIPTKPAEFLGAPGSVIGDFWEGGKQLFKGNTSKGVEKLLPTVLASPVKAVREYTEGVTSSGNLPVYYGSKPLAPDMAESITRFLGFSPARIASAREKQWNERLIEQKYTERRSGIYARFHKYFLMPPEARSKAKYLDLLAEVSQYNNDLIKSGLTKKGYSPITPKLLRANIKRGFRPSKKEKLREER